MNEIDIVQNFREICEESINPDLYSCLVDEIIPALNQARKNLKNNQQKTCELCKGSKVVWWDKFDKVVISVTDACQMPEGDAEIINCPKCQKRDIINILTTPIAFHPEDCCGCTNIYYSADKQELIAECNECGMKRQFLLNCEGSVTGSTIPCKAVPAGETQ